MVNITLSVTDDLVAKARGRRALPFRHPPARAVDAGPRQPGLELRLVRKPRGGHLGQITQGRRAATVLQGFPIWTASPQTSV
jgi:hypothetical protein